MFITFIPNFEILLTKYVKQMAFIMVFDNNEKPGLSCVFQRAEIHGLNMFENTFSFRFLLIKTVMQKIPK